MTLPKGWKAPEPPKPPTSQMPRPSLLTRPMVSLQSARVRGDNIKAMEMTQKETGAGTPIVGNFRYSEIQPIELIHSILFAPSRTASANQTSTMKIQETLTNVVRDFKSVAVKYTDRKRRSCPPNHRANYSSTGKRK